MIRPSTIVSALFCALSVSVPIAAATPQQAQTISRLRAQISKQQRAIDARNATIARKNEVIAGLTEEIALRDSVLTELRADLAATKIAIAGTIQAQLSVLSVPSLWSLLPTIKNRFPTDFLAVYSASYFQSGTYENFSFTRSP